MRVKTVLFLGSVALAVSWFMDAQRQWNARTELQRARRGDTTRRHGEEEDRLTSAIEGSFPASDPYQVGTSTALEPDRPVHRKPALIDPKSVERQADLLDRKRAGS